jgi:endonuclease/exonuclease/phosphatase family metal-dependent hydrolase
MLRLKRTATLALLLSVLFSCQTVRQDYIHPQGPRYQGRHAQGRPVFTGALRVVTYNIKLSNNLEQAIQELSTEPDLKDADIVLLQEMDPAAVEILSKFLKYNYVYYPAALRKQDDKGFGNAVLSRWPILRHQKIVLPHENPIRKMHRNAVFATLLVGELEILACSAHTEIPLIAQDKRLEQSAALLESIAEGSAYVIVGGDFNTDSQYGVRETERLFRKNGFVRANKDIGPTAKIDPLGLIEFEFDFIFVRGMEVLESGKVEGARASDHLPVWAKLEIRDDVDTP